jgi:hypothetical protein
MQHLYGVHSSANTSATNTPSAELYSIATDNMTLSNELQNDISAVLVIQTSTSKTYAKFRYATQVPYVPHSQRVFTLAGSFEAKKRSRMKFRVLCFIVILKYYFLDIFK